MSTKIIAQLNPFSSERKIWNEDDSSISEIIKKIDCQNAVNAGWRILLNDEIITDFSTVTHDGDTLYIKIVPEGDSPKELGAGEKIAGGLLTALGVAALFIPGLGPAVGIALIGSGIGLFANGCVMYNLDLSQKDRESPVQDPSIRGSKNQIRQYGNIPILFGKRRIYPDLATTAYTWVENGQQYLYQLFCCGQKNQTIDTSTIKIGETLLTDYSSSGNIGDVLSGDDSLIQMQIAYGENTPPLLTKCVHEDILNTVLKHQTEDELDGSIIRTTPENTTEINVDIFFYNGLGQYNDDGDVEDCSVTVKAWYKRSDQDDSHYVQLGHFTSDDVITEHELKTKRFSIHKTGLTANSYTVKIERVTEDSDESKIIDQCYVGSIRAIKNESPVSSARCRQLTLIGLKIKSSEKLNNYIEQLNFISQSSLPCYSGTGSGTLQWNNALSCNPASAAIYAMQSEVSQQKLNNSEIDWPAFEKLYTWCNQHEYECNEYLTDSLSISELLSAIGSTCRAEIFRQNGKITVIQDIERDGFVQLFTPRNSWDYEESIAMPDIPDAMALGFVDEEAGYVKQEAKIYNTSNGEKISEPETTQDVTLWGVTSSKQARKLGMYKYAVSRARPIVHKFSADFEYMLCGKGDWIKYAGDIALAGITQGRIASLIINGNTITGFTSDELLLMEDGQSYAVRIRKNDGTAILKNISSHSEDCMTVYFDTAVSLNVLHEGDLFTFGYVGNDSIDLIITDIHCGDNLSAEIIAVEYSPEIFAVDNPGFVLPTFINRITEIPSIEDSGELSDIEEPVKIVTTSILYAASSNGVTPPATGWDSSIPTVSPGNFLWTQTKVFYTDNKSTVSYSVAKQGATGAKGDKGDDGANAIVMTSATTPSGTYTGQIGLWQSQLYKWNGTVWENTSAILPTDSVLHYSFDEVPDIPDGNAFKKYDNNFSVSSWTALRGTISVTDGKIKVQNTSADTSFIRQSDFTQANLSGKLLKARVYIHDVNSATARFRIAASASQDIEIETDKWVNIECIIRDMTTPYYIGARFLSVSTDNYFILEKLYIGDGSYNTPIIDNANGQYNGTNYGVLASEGVSGKAIKFVGNGYARADLPFDIDTTYKYSVSAWVKDWDKSTTCYLINNWSSYAISSLWLRMAPSVGNITTDVCYEAGRVRRYTFPYDFNNDINLYHIVLIADDTSTSLYINGKKITGTYISSDTGSGTQGRNWFQIGRYYSSSGWLYSKATIDDFQIFNRALTEEEVLGLYLSKGNTPIYYTLKDYQLASIDDDGIISPSEKKQLIAKWHEIYNADNVTSALPTSSITAQGEYKSVIDDAVSLGILSITAIDNYRQSANALRDLFWGTNGYLNNLKTQSATRIDINLDNLLANYQKVLQDARTAIGQQQVSVASALGVSNSNPFCLIPVNATTGNPDYTNTGTRLQVFNGTTQLTPKASGTLADGEWKVTVTRDHITEGNQTIGDGYIDFGDVSAMTDTHADLTFNIVAKVNGVENTIYTVQKFTQAQEGADGRIYDLRTEQGVVKKSPEGVLTPSSITVQAYSWTASNPPALFGTGDLKAYENNVQVGTTVSQGNSITVSPSGNYPVVVKLFKHGTNTVLDVINIPVLNEVKGNTGDTGERGSKEFSGTEINRIINGEQTETLTTASTGITSTTMPIYVGDSYVNTLTNDEWICTTEGTPSTAKWTYQGRIKTDKDDTNLFRFFDAEHDYTSISSTFTKAVQTAENPFGYNDKILHITNTNGIQYSRAIPYYRSVRVNTNRKYRYVLYIKQNDSKRRDYFGIVDNQSAGGVTHITSLSGGTVSNGYFGSSTNLGTLGTWYMIVAYVMPYSASTTTAPSDAGIYNCSTKRKISTTVTNYKWKNDGDINISHNGTLIRYADTAKTDTSTADIYDIRFDECNGNEPTIDELLNIDTSVKNKGAWTANTDYYIGDIVTHSGSSYICKTNHNSGSTWATTNWDLLSEKGETGNTGKATHVSDYASTRTWTNAQWNDYTTKGRSTGWSNVTGSPTIKIGDIFIVYATLSEQENIIGQVYCEVTGITGSGSSWTITSKTLYGVKGEKGQTGDRGFSSRTITFRANHDTFSRDNKGEVYVCGYDASGAESDTAGYVIVDGTTYYAKGMVNTNIACDGYLVIPTTSTSSSSPSIPRVAYLSNIGSNMWYVLKNGQTSNYAENITDANLGNWIVIGKMYMDSEEGNTQVEPVTPCKLSTVTQPFNYYFEGIVSTLNATVNNVSNSLYHAKITPYKIVQNSSTSYSVSALTDRYARRGAVVLQITNLTSTPSTATIYFFNGAYWNTISSSDSRYYDVISLMAGSLPVIAGYYVSKGQSVPSVCGTYIETLTSNMAIINRLFSQQITLLTGGSIQSQNYKPYFNGQYFDEMASDNTDYIFKYQGVNVFTFNKNAIVGLYATENPDYVPSKEMTEFTEMSAYSCFMSIANSLLAPKYYHIKYNNKITSISYHTMKFNGFKQNTNGDVQFAGNTKIGGNLEVVGSGVFGSDCVFNGDISGSRGTFKGDLDVQDILHISKMSSTDKNPIDVNKPNSISAYCTAIIKKAGSGTWFNVTRSLSYYEENGVKYPVSRVYAINGTFGFDTLKIYDGDTAIVNIENTFAVTGLGHLYATNASDNEPAITMKLNTVAKSGISNYIYAGTDGVVRIANRT